MKDALTTGEVAKYCGVNFRTVIRWIEKGYIEAYKLPGRGDNRIPIEAFISFLAKNNMPVPEELVTPQNKEGASESKSAHDPTMRRVLIIEDEELMAKSMERTMKRAGYIVDIASNGIEAGIKLEVFAPDLITLDLQMPGMSGFEILEALKANKKYLHIKILVVSAATKLKIVEVMSLGVDDVLEKPFTAEVLKNKLKALFEQDQV